MHEKKGLNGVTFEVVYGLMSGAPEFGIPVWILILLTRRPSLLVCRGSPDL